MGVFSIYRGQLAANTSVMMTEVILDMTFCSLLCTRERDFAEFEHQKEIKFFNQIQNFFSVILNKKKFLDLGCKNLRSFCDLRILQKSSKYT